MNTTNEAIDIKKGNMVTIINCLNKYKNISFSDINEKTGISIPTISRHMKFFLKNNLVIESGIEKVPLGRHAKLSEFNYNYKYVIGMHIGESKIRVALTNLEGTNLSYKSIYTKDAGEGYDILDKVLLMIDDAINETSITLNDITAIGIGVPGITNIETGVVAEAPNIKGWNNIGVYDYMKNKLNQKIFIDNDANMAVLGESWHPLNNNIENTIFITIGTGIGSGIIINGSLYRGRNNSSGEIGFMAPMEEENARYYTSKGFLESKASMFNLYLDVLEEIKKDKYSVLNSIMPECAFENYADFEIDYVDSAAAMNDGTAIKVIAPYINYWGSLIVNSISVLAPDIVFVGGDINVKNTYIYNKLMQYLNKYLRDKPDIYFVREGHRSEVYGAVKVGIEYTFEQIYKGLC